MSKKSQSLLHSFLRELASMSMGDVHLLQYSWISRMISMISEILREIKLSAEGEHPLGNSKCYLRGHLGFFCLFFGFFSKTAVPGAFGFLHSHKLNENQVDQESYSAYCTVKM